MEEIRATPPDYPTALDRMDGPRQGFKVQDRIRSSGLSDVGKNGPEKIKLLRVDEQRLLYARRHAVDVNSF